MIASALLSWGASPVAAAPMVFSASGNNPAAIQATVNAFRTQLGTLNANVAGSFGTGRREINWDGVPDAFATPGALPGGFFNSNSPRGVVMSTPGTGFAVSATAASGVGVEFSNINATYDNLFRPFSVERLFTAIGSNITDIDFLVPGSLTDGAVSGFGVVFTDVDLATSTTVTFYDMNDASLGTFAVPASAGSNRLSFLGVFFTEALPVVDRVRIVSGTGPLGPNDAPGQGRDLVVMDDFIYGEPSAIPAPGALAVFAVGLGLLTGLRRRR